MARNLDQLTAREVTGKLTPGKHSDGGGLYLIVTPAGAKSWAFHYKRGGKRTEMGLGSADNVTLKTARRMAADAREVIGRGLDPLEERRAAEKAREEEAKAKKLDAEQDTFGVFALRLLDGYTETDERGRLRKVPGIVEGNRNAKHRAQWKSTLIEYARPLWKLKLDEVDTDSVLKCLAPIWTTKAETAARVRGRIEKVLAAAIARGLRKGPNPALLRGHLDALLPKRQKLQRGHHPALPWRDIGEFWPSLAALNSVSALCLRFTILTAARSGEARGAKWHEIDLSSGVWTVPAERMKAGREHIVPLSEAAKEVLTEAEKLRQTEDGDEMVFPSVRDRKPLSDMAILMCLRGIRAGITVHGFRSAFRDWAGDATPYPREVVEQALAHTVGGVEGAYRRGTAVEKRRRLMADWAAFVTAKPSENVVAFERSSL